jgi:prolipoprotein diacylglyceryltransferase
MYGLLIGATAIFSILTAEKVIQERKIGISTKEFWNLIIVIFFLGLIGGRIYHGLDRFSFYAQNPISIFYIWNGGMGIFGSIILLSTFFVLYSKFFEKNLFIFTDLLCFFVPFVQIAGRVGNYFNNELAGTHIEIIVFIFFIFFELVNFKKIIFGKGNLTAVYFMVYGITRLVEEFFRNPKDSFILCEVNITYILSLIITGFGLAILLKCKSQRSKSKDKCKI